MARPASAQESVSDDIRPVVRTDPASNLGFWAFLAFLLLAGLLLFSALESRRMGAAAPATSADLPLGAMIDAPPPLVLPYRFSEPPVPMVPSEPAPDMAERVVAPPVPERIVTRTLEVPTYSPSPVIAPAPLPARPVPAFDAPAEPGAARADENGERVLATRLANPSLTVPKGTVIAAVLESALDSTRAGAVRALVSRDIMGFDGTRVLIPRGSRLYGEYDADLNHGQNRALIRWTRLLRPDGVMINLDSPAADPLGRAGVRGKVDTHFFSRFGGAILQSVLDIGVGLATRSVSDDTVILALPANTQGLVTQQQQQQVRPTLTVKQGTSVSVFVAHDLDFSSVEG